MAGFGFGCPEPRCSGGDAWAKPGLDGRDVGAVRRCWSWADGRSRVEQRRDGVVHGCPSDAASDDDVSVEPGDAWRVRCGSCDAAGWFWCFAWRVGHFAGCVWGHGCHAGRAGYHAGCTGRLAGCTGCLAGCADCAGRAGRCAGSVGRCAGCVWRHGRSADCVWRDGRHVWPVWRVWRVGYSAGGFGCYAGCVGVDAVGRCWGASCRLCGYADRGNDAADTVGLGQRWRSCRWCCVAHVGR